MTSIKLILEAMTNAYPSMPKQLRRAAKYILENPEEVALQSMRRVSVEAGVAPTTLTRLCTQLDFENYNDFRAIFERSVKQRGPNFANRTEWLQALATDAPDHNGQLIAQYSEASLQNLALAMHENSAAQLMEAVKLMQEAKVVYVTSVGAMYYLAGYFQSVGEMIMPRMKLVDPLGAVGINDLSRMGEHDVLFVLSFEPYAKGSVKSAHFAGMVGAKLIVVTESRAAPAAANADSLLLVSTKSPLFYPSQTAVVALLELLLALLAAEGGARVLGRLKDIESFRSNTSVYWQD